MKRSTSKKVEDEVKNGEPKSPRSVVFDNEAHQWRVEAERLHKENLKLRVEIEEKKKTIEAYREGAAEDDRRPEEMIATKDEAVRRASDLFTCPRWEAAEADAAALREVLEDCHIHNEYVRVGAAHADRLKKLKYYGRPHDHSAAEHETAVGMALSGAAGRQLLAEVRASRAREQALVEQASSPSDVGTSSSPEHCDHCGGTTHGRISHAVGWDAAVDGYVDWSVAPSSPSTEDETK